MKWIALAVTLALFASRPCLAARGENAFTLDGERLLALCTGSGPGEQQACFGYVTGVQDDVVTSDINTVLPRVCVPKGTKVGSIRDAVVRYLRDNEKDRKKPAAEMVRTALTESFGCR